jgi:hypothetical protein
MPTSDQIFSVFEQFCKEYKIHFYQSDEGIFTTNVRGNIGKLEVKCYIGESYLLFISILPIIVPPEKQQAVMEFITIVNFDRIIGSFEMNLKNGDVGFKTSITTVDVQMTPATIYVLLKGNIGVADYYLEGINHVIHRDWQPSVALAKLEKSEEEMAEEDSALCELLNDLDLDQVLSNGDD